MPNDEFPGGQNGLECRSCPYQFLIKDRVYERTEFKRKEVEDVIDDKDALANADKTDGVCSFARSSLDMKKLLTSEQRNVHARAAMGRRLSSTKCRFAVRMSL